MCPLNKTCLIFLQQILPIMNEYQEVETCVEVRIIRMVILSLSSLETLLELSNII